jgi:hypothetical protein
MSDIPQTNWQEKSSDLADSANPVRGLKEATRRDPSRMPPEAWNPPYCGDIDMRIAGDGMWYYLKSPIGRKPLVKMFASVLRREADDRYYLVTPVEKCGIAVDDAPFLAIAMSLSGQGRNQTLTFTTNLDDAVVADQNHPLRFAPEPGTGGLKPYVLVRGRLEALLSRSLFYDLVAIGEVAEQSGADWFGVWSAGRFWPMAPACEIVGAYGGRP